MSRQLLFQLLALPAKAAVNAYTWSTLPFYTLYQKPFSKLRLAKNFGVISTVDPKTGRRVYSRPTPPDIDHPYLKYQVFNDIIPTLDRNREVLGIRDVISEVPAVDEQTGEPVIIDGKPLVKVQLADDFRYLKVGEVLDRVEAIAKGLKENLGVNPGDHVMIYADNSAEWFYSCLALLQINAVMVTLFSTLNDSGVVFGINHSDAKFVITSKRLLPKINRLSGQFEKVKSIVYIDENGKNDDGNVEQLKAKGLEVVSLEQLAENGSKLPKMDFPSPNPDDTMLIMYTSGTTGNPKGVIISYRNFSAELHSLLRMDLENDKICFSSVFAGYLPQAHLFGLVMNLGLFISDSKIAFCSPFTLLDSSPAHIPGQVGDLRLIAPEFLVAVPLMLERIIKEIYRKLNERSSISAPVFTYLMDYKIRWTARGFDTPIINRLVCKKINDQFGGRLRLIGVSSAPLNEKTQALAQAAMGVKVVQAYGSTEMAGGSHVTLQNDLNYGTSGVPYHGIKYYLEDWPEGGYSANDKPNPRGEIVVGGDTITNGYYKLPEETKEVFFVDDQGTRWFKSGDIGEVLPDGTLKIIDRRKDLQKLANGEFVSLGKIEAGLRSSPFVENICVCTHPYSNHLTAVISPNNRALLELAAKLGIMLNGRPSVAELCANKTIRRQIFSSIQSLGTELGFKIREIPADITLVPEDWAQVNLLTAAMKTKRRQVNYFYRGEIARMFEQLSAAEETIGAPAVGGAFESVGGGLQFGGKNGENGVTSGA